ncbi:MAG TPA: 5-(carboxyamino)imidazole ribonucleotide mutase [Nitrososphaeraceae archaeon]|nr:5-(carboxyamino)imidazole ribonucleotide mutase [Nitrososphaeraceae archaeon]
MSKIQVAIIMGSDSDLRVMKEAAKILEYFDIEYELTIVSAHRTPERMFQYASNAIEKGIKVIIAGAGGAAHLPGMIASLTSIPVIGVPIKSSTSLEGLDSLLSIVQMPPGIPVATVAINGSKNAGILACQILGTRDNLLLDKIERYKKEIKNQVISKANKLEEIGWKEYLSS